MMKKMTYEEIGKSVGKLVTEKQKAYGDSFGNSHEILLILYPNGIKKEQYIDVLTLARIIDKMFRIANEKEAFDESPYRDMMGYCLLGYSKSLKEKEEEFYG